MDSDGQQRGYQRPSKEGENLNEPPLPTFNNHKDLKMQVASRGDLLPSGAPGRSLYGAIRSQVESLLVLADRLFNLVFTSSYNPLYRSGTLAIALLVIASISGVFLLFFYRVSDPYSSLQSLSDSPWIAWVRTLHRYSSDGMILATLLHVLRMFAQGKSWGPRTLAWISGVILLVVVVATAWTGFVMTWDSQAQVLLSAIATIIDSTAVLADPISQALSGYENRPPSSFFFLLLFLHVVLPLAMIFGLWVHTSRMARATWFPTKTIFIAVIAAFAGVSILLAAPLGSEPNLLQLQPSFYINLFYNLGLLYTDNSPFLVLGLTLAGIFGIGLVPFLLRPKRDQIAPKSDLDPLKCNGCVQCVMDCPYEAIKMVPRTEGSIKLSEMIAQVSQDLCVSCGLCAASCARMTVGPTHRKGSDQYDSSRELVRSLQNAGEQLASQVVVIGCTNQPYTAYQLKMIQTRTTRVRVYPVACMGSIHMATIGYLAHYFKGVVLAACPERNCLNKDAFMLLRDRLAGLRIPGLPGRVDPKRVHLLSVGDGEHDKVDKRTQEIVADLPLVDSGDALVVKHKNHSSIRGGLAGLGAIASVACIALMSAIEITPPPRVDGAIRLSWRLAGQSSQQCRQRSQEELESIPVHMRRPEECSSEPLSYQLKVSVDGAPSIDKVVHPSGMRGDGPLYVHQDIAVAAGRRRVEVAFSPALKNGANLEISPLELRYSGEIEVIPGFAALLHISPSSKQLVVKTANGSNEVPALKVGL